MKGRLVGAEFPRGTSGQAARGLGARRGWVPKTGVVAGPWQPRGFAVLLHRGAAWPALPRSTGKP